MSAPRKARAALEGLLHEPPWLLWVRLAAAAQVGVELDVGAVRSFRRSVRRRPST